MASQQRMKNIMTTRQRPEDTKIFWQT